MLLRLQKYDFELVYRPGTQVIVADALSRAYIPNSACSTQFTAELASLIDEEIASDLRMVASEATIGLLRNAAAEDEIYQMLISQIMRGWPSNPDHCSSELKDYYPFADELAVSDGLIFKGCRVVVPLLARQDMLSRIHSSHIGVNGCIRRAREALFWPGMTLNVKQYVDKCSICQNYQMSSTKEPLMFHEIPRRPWQKVGVDIFQFKNHEYLITCDYLSGYFEVDRLPSKRVSDIIYVLKQQFARHGIPESVFTDNSPFASREFDLFATKYEFKHRTSSPRYPQSNGKVENSVKTAKRIMTKAVESGADPFLALLDWRNTPSEQLQMTPTQIMFGRRTRTKLPTTETLLKQANAKQARLALQQSKNKQAEYYNRTAKQKTPLKLGQTVRFKEDENSNWRKGEVTKVLPFRSYQIEGEDGRSKRRTSKHVRPTSESPIVRQHIDSQHDLESLNSREAMIETGQNRESTCHTQLETNSRAELVKVNESIMDNKSSDKMTQMQQNNIQLSDKQVTSTTRSGRSVVLPARYRN